MGFFRRRPELFKNDVNLPITEKMIPLVRAILKGLGLLVISISIAPIAFAIDQSVCIRQLLERALEDIENYQTTFIVADRVEQGRHGGSLIIVGNKGEWGDPTKRTVEQAGHDAGDLVADLRIVPLVMGRQRSQFFGYNWNRRARTISVPDHYELNNAIHRFNEGLAQDDPRRILLSVYPTQEVFVSSVEYRRRFATNFEIPVAISRRQFFHDIVGHGLQAFFLPNQIIRGIHSRVRLWHEFMESLSSRGLTLLPEVRELDRRISDDLVHPIDNLGNFMGLFISPRFMPHLYPAVPGGTQTLLRGSRIITENPSVFFESIFASSRTPARWQKEFESFYQGYRQSHPEVDQVFSADSLARQFQEVRDIYSQTSFPEPRILERHEFTAPFGQRLHRLDEINHQRQ